MTAVTTLTREETRTIETPIPRNTRGPGRVIFLAHSSYLSAFRIGSHQLARAFAHEGWEVLHVPTPVTPAHIVKAPLSSDYRMRLRRAMHGPDWIERHVRELIPFVWTPWPIARRFGSHAIERFAWAAGSLHRRAAMMGFHRPDLLFIDEPRLAGLVAGFEPRTVIYRATDLYGHLKQDPAIIEAERRCLQLASGYIATSAPVQEHLRNLNPETPGCLVPNGVEFARFSRPAMEPSDLAQIRWPRLVYAGALDERFDWHTVSRLAERRRDYQIVLIGPRPARPPRLPDNVHLLGPRPYDALPGYLQHCVAGLLPLSPHPANVGRSPMKLYEYGAAGLPVVATHTLELARRNLPFVKLYQDADEAVVVTDEAVLNAPELGARAVETSRLMGWETRLGEILDFCATLPATAALERTA